MLNETVQQGKHAEVILSWLNALHVQEKPVASLSDLRDGVVFAKLLHKVYFFALNRLNRDSEWFPLEGLNMEAKDHWTICEANLQKLYKGIDKYIKTFLRIPTNNVRLDIQGIARDKNMYHLLLLSEHVLGIAGNCKYKEKYIDAILQLDEQAQAILMEIMVKYLSQEDSPTNIDNELVESLQTQLREKEIEHIAVLEHLKKLEQENNELASKIDSIEKGQTEILNENQQLKKEIEDLRRASLGVEFIQREKELEADIDYYSKEIKILQAQLAEQEKIKQQEISRLQDELYILQAKLKKAATLEAVSGQQKKQIEELLENEEIFKKELLKVATAEEQVKMLEKRNKELETKNIALMSEYYEDKNRVLNMEAELKKTLNNCSKVEKELKKTKETTRFWEQKAKQSENDIKQLQEELDSYRLVSGAGCLLTQEKEASYQAEITKLRKQVTDIISSTEEKVKVRALELEAKLEVSLAEKDRLTQELVLAGQRRDELEKDNEDLLNKIANCKRTEELASNLVTDLNRTKKDRDLLLDVSKRAQNALAEQEKMRAKINKTKEECIRLQSLLTKCESEKTLVEAELKEMCDKNLKLEKELARNEEKIAQMEQEKKKLESSFQNQARHIEMETEKKMSQLFKSEFETARLKYKEKIKDYKTQISEKDKNLSKAYEEVRTTEAKYTETLKRFKEEYERSIKSLNERIAQEKENAKRGIREIAETSKREEQLLSTAIYEISGIINQLMKDKHKGLTATAAQKMLNKLADVSSFRSSIGSQGESDNKDRTLKENQSFKQL